MLEFDLAGKKALVTGGNRGIGAAVVAALHGAGAEVVYTTRGHVGPVGRAVRLDVTDRVGVVALMAEAFDIVVNNAGIVTPIGRMVDVAVEDWAQNISVNLVAAFHVVQQAIRARPKGLTIVNLSSGAARGPMEGWSAYCAGKAGLAMLTKGVHLEYAPGVRVFGFAPGVVDTDMQGVIRASGINAVSKIPRENLAGVEGPAQAIAWLCTPAADGYAGQEVDVRNAEFRAASGLPVLA